MKLKFKSALETKENSSAENSKIRIYHMYAPCRKEIRYIVICNAKLFT